MSSCADQNIAYDKIFHSSEFTTAYPVSSVILEKENTLLAVIYPQIF